MTYHIDSKQLKFLILYAHVHVYDMNGQIIVEKFLQCVLSRWTNRIIEISQIICVYHLCNFRAAFSYFSTVEYFVLISTYTEPFSTRCNDRMFIHV